MNVSFKCMYVYVCVCSLRDGAVGVDLVREVRRRQRAVVALVFNFAAPGRSSRDDPLLALHEVRAHCSCKFIA